ncbi:MAG: hypothetical protein A2284_10880 [Deltaproteobacteria bacterium RIFOXYA12_FULL_61_11]|nr:MAG: hypothetical protein A2284_10880 [Deltaproteobacteria bacterium RIFOXYA12_FULL_61_11]
MAGTPRIVRHHRGLRDYTFLGCPLTRNRTPWCFRTCVPASDGRGACGRIAAHGILDRIQLAMVKHKAKAA